MKKFIVILGLGMFCSTKRLMHKPRITYNAYCIYSRGYFTAHTVGYIKDRVAIREFETKLDFYALNDATVIYYVPHTSWIHLQ